MKAQPSDSERKKLMAAAKADAEQYIELIRPKLFDDLSGAEAKIYKQIHFRVGDKDIASTATSLWEDGQRVIQVEVGYSRQIEMAAEAIIIEDDQNRSVLIPYARYVASQWAAKAQFTKDPTVFAHYDGPLDEDPATKKIMIPMILNGMAFVLAHEVGHHVLGDYDKPFPKDAEQLRHLEERADAWAIDRCVKSHFSPMGGMLPLLMDYYMSRVGVSIFGQDHPASVKRIQSMFIAMEDALPQYRKELEDHGQSYDGFRQWLKTKIRTYQSEIDDDSPSVSDLGTVSRERHHIDPDPPPQRLEYGAFCGDIYGRRVCQMAITAPLGTYCQCPYVPGYGVTVR